MNMSAQFAWKPLRAAACVWNRTRASRCQRKPVAQSRQVPDFLIRLVGKARVRGLAEEPAFRPHHD
jgi:hypothetical protein